MVSPLFGPAPPVSVVLPVLNEAERVGQRLAELTRGGFEEILVVDGGSTDQTESIVRRAQASDSSGSSIRWLTSIRGRGHQLNRGARAAVHPILLFVHADVQLPAGAKPMIVSCLEDPRVIAGCFRTWHTDDTARGASRALRWALRFADLRSRYTKHPYGDQCLFLYRNEFERVGGFPDQPLMEDLELSRRLARKGNIKTLAQTVSVSGRRFLAQPVRTFVMQSTFPLLYAAGVSPDSLARLYQQVR